MEFLFKTYAVVVSFVTVVAVIFYIAMIGAFVTLNAIRRAIRMMSRHLQKRQSAPASRVVAQGGACMVRVMSTPTVSERALSPDLGSPPPRPFRRRDSRYLRLPHADASNMVPPH